MTSWRALCIHWYSNINKNGFVHDRLVSALSFQHEREIISIINRIRHLPSLLFKHNLHKLLRVLAQLFLYIFNHSQGGFNFFPNEGLPRRFKPKFNPTAYVHKPKCYAKMTGSSAKSMYVELPPIFGFRCQMRPRVHIPNQTSLVF